MFDTTIRDTREKLLTTLRESQLHIDIIVLILETLFMEYKQQADIIYQESRKETTNESA